MFKTLAHAGHSHDMAINEVSEIDHCTPIIIGSSIVIVTLLIVIVYFLVAWRPKNTSKDTKKKTKKK